jgi:hypothetical protein
MDVFTHAKKILSAIYQVPFFTVRFEIVKTL